MMRKNVQHRQAIFHAAPRRNFVTQDDFFAPIMHPRIEVKRADLARKQMDFVIVEATYSTKTKDREKKPSEYKQEKKAFNKKDLSQKKKENFEQKKEKQTPQNSPPKKFKDEWGFEV